MKKSIKIIVLFIPFTFVFSQQQWTLQQCVDYASSKNLSILQSQNQEKIAAKSLKISENEKLPSVNGNFNNSLSFGFQRTLLGTYEYNQSYTNNWNVGADVILWQKDKLKLDNQKAALQVDNQKINTLKLQNDLSLQIVSQYLQILLNRELAAVSETQKKIGADQLDKIQKLYRAGSIPYSQVAEQQASFSMDEMNAETAKVNVEKAVFQLAMLLQISDYKKFSVIDVAIPEKIDEELLNIDQIIQYAYDHQPSVDFAKKQKDISLVEESIARTALWPTVTGGYSLGSTYFNYFNIKEDNILQQWYDNHNQVVSLGVSIPIFNKGNTKIRIEQAQLNTEYYSNSIEQEKLSLKQTIQSAYFDLEAAYEVYTNAINNFNANKTSFEYAQKSFNAGKITIYDFNISRNNVAISESRLLQAKYDYIFKRKVLDFYAGKPLKL